MVNPPHTSRLVFVLAFQCLHLLCYNNDEISGVDKLDLERYSLMVLEATVVSTHHQPSEDLCCNSGEISIDCSYG